MTTPNVLLLCDDLLFGSRIGAAARSHGAEVRTAKSVDAALGVLSSQTPACVIADLAVVGDRLGEIMTTITPMAQRPIVVGYGSHVDTAQLRAAADAGCDVVLPRSQFVVALEVEMPQWLAPRQV